MVILNSSLKTQFLHFLLAFCVCVEYWIRGGCQIQHTIKKEYRKKNCYGLCDDMSRIILHLNLLYFKKYKLLLNICIWECLSNVFLFHNRIFKFKIKNSLENFIILVLSFFKSWCNLGTFQKSVRNIFCVMEASHCESSFHFGVVVGGCLWLVHWPTQWSGLT